MPVDTTSASNTNTLLSNYSTFAIIWLEFKASNKRSETMRKKLSELYKVLLQADATVQFSKYKYDNKREKESKNLSPAHLTY